MRKSEEKFLKAVTSEIKTLPEISEELGMDYNTALKYAQYLSQHNLIRLNRFEFQNGNHGYTVCSPLEKDPVHRAMINGLILTGVGVLLGGLLSVTSALFLTKPQPSSEPIQVSFPKVLIVHDTVYLK